MGIPSKNLKTDRQKPELALHTLKERAITRGVNFDM